MEQYITNLTTQYRTLPESLRYICNALSVDTTAVHSVMKCHGLLNATDAWKYLPNDDLMTASVVNVKHARRATVMTRGLMRL